MSPTPNSVNPPRPEDPGTEDAWDIDRAAKFLGMARKTLYKMAVAGKVPSFKVGFSRRFIPSSLAAWRKAQEQGGQS